MFKIFLMCLGLHLFADYTLQGILAQMKQVSWWRKQTDDPMYKHDWACAMFCHALYWTLVTFAPVIYLWHESTILLAVLLGLNVTAHFAIDDLKANGHQLNLWQDQVLHLMQVGGTVLWLSVLGAAR